MPLSAPSLLPHTSFCARRPAAMRVPEIARLRRACTLALALALARVLAPLPLASPPARSHPRARARAPTRTRASLRPSCPCPNFWENYIVVPELFDSATQRKKRTSDAAAKRTTSDAGRGGEEVHKEAGRFLNVPIPEYDWLEAKFHPLTLRCFDENDDQRPLPSSIAYSPLKGLLHQHLSAYSPLKGLLHQHLSSENVLDKVVERFAALEEGMLEKLLSQRPL
ncbi:hypothetical protein AXF42_Ash013557 [Apostasia shenzhenica]|uniref:Uncharacterized protein n=1 Tax=Apostasia shenzhenica TaxID=1088818 RepID=A0A2I0AP92_9ASPA|nr:hypothetical protein AXF42_Ash013557 [Apostasia shenzhenica]